MIHDYEFPNAGAPIHKNATGAASANDLAQTHPHRLHADRLIAPRIALRSTQPTVADPVLAALSTIDDAVGRLVAPWIVPPPDSEPFHSAAGIVIPGQDGLFHSVVSVQCPNGRNGVLMLIANEFVGGGLQDFVGNIVYQIQRNRPSTAGAAAAERNFENMSASFGTSQQPGRLAAGIRIFENDVIELMVKNVNIVVAGQFIGGLLGGWFYPRTYDEGY